MAAENAWTVGRLLQWTTDYLSKHGSGSPRLDAEVLLAHVRRCPRIALYTSFDIEPPEAEKSQFRELVKKRAAGEPVAYLVGGKEFFSLPFAVTPDVLIPRPETEHLVTALLDAAKAMATEATLSMVDVGTGSGAIAVCAAKYLTNSKIYAVDVSEAALDVARKNAATHGVDGRIEFVHSDLLQALSHVSFDFVVSNPPYLSSAEYEALDPQVRNFEPRAALLAGETGVEVITRLADQSKERLVRGGQLMLEVSPMIAQAVEQLLQGQGYQVLPTVKDLAGKARVVRAIWG